MMALVGATGPFDQGRQQLKILAGLEVTTKAVERTAEGSEKMSPRVSRRRFSAPYSWIYPS